MLKMREEKGVSLIALVITIIVVIILAAIAFNSSTSTIARANYSKFVNNVSEVQGAMNQKAVLVKGMMAAGGAQVTDGQVYNYIAKGGANENDLLVEAQVPNYTVIEETADIGIKLPEMKVNTQTQTGVKVRYAITKEGIVFIWPPFPSEEKYYIRADETVNGNLASNSGEFSIIVANKELKLETNEDGVIQTSEILSDGLSKKEFDELKSKINVGDFVKYELTTSVTVETDPSKTGFDTVESLTTDTTAKWRVLDIDDKTGKVLIATQGMVNGVTLNGAIGYFYGVSELNRLCEALYSNKSKSITARSMTIEDINKVAEYTPVTEGIWYAWYPATTTDAEMQSVTAGGKTYVPIRHSATLGAGVTSPRFYTWDDVNGVTHTATSESKYNDKISKSTPMLTTKTGYNYDPGANNPIINQIIGDGRAWLASAYLSIGAVTECASFGMRTLQQNKVYGNRLYYSTGVPYATKWGIRPVFSISIGRIDVSDTTGNGTEATPWIIK